MNLTKTLIFFILFILMMSISTAKNPTILLVIDMHDVAALPGHFRTTSMPVPSDIDHTGFENLHIIGSRQFSKQAFAKVLQDLHIKKVLVVDLRQESHGFLNGEAVSWFGKQNAANAGKTPKEIEEIQARLLHELSQQKVVTVYEILNKTEDGQIEKIKPIKIAVHNVMNENEWVNANRMQYQRFYVQDFHSPDATEVDRFIKFVNHDHKGEWIYFHCRGGSGRSTMFMAMYDMMMNAKTVSFNDIIARQTAIGGKDLIKLSAPDNYKYKPSLQRLDFIKKFYQYCQTNHDHYRTLWSDWLKASSDAS